jgi:tetratricopeptide (TPR) repeat protein
MRRAELAQRLISAANDAARTRLLTQNRRQADVKLARAIRKACYAAWTVEPVKARRAAAAMRCLAKISNNDETDASFFWVSGISDITRAKFESAIDNLDKAAAVFARIGLISDSAQTQVAKLLALAMLGRYDEAIRTGQEALKIFVREGDELAAGKIEMNMSNIVSRQSLNLEAEKYCKSALRRFTKCGDNLWRILAENGLANIYAELNDFNKADRYYRMALEGARAGKMRVTEAEVEASIGNLAMVRGRYAEALNFLERSRQKYDDLAMPHQSAIADLEIADIYSELNLGDEAIEIYERVARSFMQLKLTAEEARARLNYGRAATSAGDSSTANRELKKALKLFQMLKNNSGQTAVLLSLSQLAMDGNDNLDARSHLAQASAAMRKGENARHAVQLTLLEGELLRRTGNDESAVKKLTDAHVSAKRHRQMNAMQFALNALGKIAVSRGENAKATSFFTSAIKVIENLRFPLASEEMSMAFFASKLEPYENLTQLLLDNNKISAAFAVIESGRSRALLDAVPGRSDLSSNGSKKLQEEMRELRSELNSSYKRLDRSAASETARLSTDIDRIEAKLTKTLRQIGNLAAARPGQHPRPNGAFSVRRLQQQLSGSTTIIEYVEFDGEISAFVVAHTKVKYVRHLTSSAEVGRTLEDLHFQFGSLRYGNLQVGRFIDALKARADDCLQRLYDQLLRPIEKEITGSRLIIVPVGVLNYVPFHALHNGREYALERFETSYSPSAGVWSALQERILRKIKNSLLMGYADERIPLVEGEIREIQTIVPHPTTLVGGSATFSGFLENASKFDLIHLACHGKFRAENPMFSSLHLADGWITVRDICSQKLRAGLVTLSACETGLSKVFAGEEILGLARGFLTAGADTMVVSLWAVNDVAAGHLMSDFYKNLQRGESIQASLREAQMAFVERGEHPFYWSPFILIGK